MPEEPFFSTSRLFQHLWRKLINTAIEHIDSRMIQRICYRDVMLDLVRSKKLVPEDAIQAFIKDVEAL